MSATMMVVGHKLAMRIDMAVPALSRHIKSDPDYDAALLQIAEGDQWEVEWDRVKSGPRAGDIVVGVPPSALREVLKRYGWSETMKVGLGHD